MVNVTCPHLTCPHDHPVTHANLRISGRFGHQHVQNRG